MKKMKEVNYIFYMTLLYMFSSLYRVLETGKIYRIFRIKKLIRYDSLIIIVIGLGIIFLLVNYYRNTKQVLGVMVFKIIIPMVVILLGLNYPNFGLDGIIYAMVVYLIVTYIFMYPIIFCKSREDENDNNLKLYPSRKNLVDVLNHALGDYSLIALDGTWGSGKTTFMNIFMRENSEKFYYIPINIMLFENRNSLKTEFLNQLKVIFKEEGIFQGSLMDFDYYLDGVSNDWVKVIKNIIFSKSKSFKEANKKLKSEIGKIEKRIVVGVDNLERIYGESEPEWKQILGFIHELQELGIKIVVMADLEKMLTTKKETGEKDLSNHEYFDKFYEDKLKLNEVTTEEIIDEVKDITESEKSWLKKEFEDLSKNLTIGYKKKKEEVKEISSNLKGSELALNMTENDEEHINKISRKIEKNKKNVKQKEIILSEFEEKYYKNIKNPRKIEKIIKDIKSKKKIEKIHKINQKKYENLIFKTSVFQLFYFNYFYKFKNEEKGIFGKILEEKDIFLECIENDFTYNIKAVSRLLYYEKEDENMKKRIENLNEDSMITIDNLERYLEDIKVYSQRLDKSDLEITKEKYKIIELKLIEL